jgi:uncharacterized membrane protein
MQDSMTYVILGVLLVGAIVAVVCLVGSGKLYDQIGRGGLSLNEDGPPAPEPGGALHAQERDDEIRQMLRARNARRVARGEAEHDVELELAELTRPRLDAALLAEIREMVVARNNRRVARGREPLDVEAEIERQVRDLGG